MDQETVLSYENWHNTIIETFTQKAVSELRDVSDEELDRAMGIVCPRCLDQAFSDALSAVHELTDRELIAFLTDRPFFLSQEPSEFDGDFTARNIFLKLFQEDIEYDLWYALKDVAHNEFGRREDNRAEEYESEATV